MYANKIMLIGTEAGLGARNAGTIQAANGAGTLAGAGQLVVTAAGRLENIGTLQASAGANLSADSLANSGSIASGGELKIATQGTLGNAGGTLEGPRVEFASAGGDIDNRGGTIRQTSGVGLTVAAPRLSNTAGGVIGAEPIPEAPAQPNPGTGTGGTGTGGTTDPGTPTTGDGGGTGTGTGTGTGSSGGTAPSQPYMPPAPGSVTAAGSILNDGGRIYAGGPIALQTPQVNNNGGTLATTSLAASGPSFSNVGGTVNVANNFSAHVDRFDNTGGTLRAGSLNIAAAGDLVNQDGKLESNGDASLSAGGALHNARGIVSAAGSLTANASGALDNSAGTLLANQGVALDVQSLDNSKGIIQSATAGTRLTVANQVLNAEGTIGAATDLSVQAGSLNNSGSLRGGNDTALEVAGTLINDGSITSGRHTTITAGSLQSTGVLGAGIQADGKLGSAGDLRVTTTGALVATGTQLAAGGAALQGASIDLSSSSTSAANLALTATQGNVSTSGATVVTPGTLSVSANVQSAQTLVNDAGTLNAGQLDLRASNVTNANGGEIVQTGTGATTIATSGAIDNTQGRIATNGQDLSLSAASITSTAGQIEHAGSGTLSIGGGSYSGANGQITGNGALVVNLAGAFNQDGGNTYAKQITLDAGALSNQGGKIVQGEAGATRITVVGALNNNAGTIASNGNTAVAAGSLSNQGGTIRAAETSNLGLTVGGMLDNSKGEIGAGGSTTLNAGSLNNSAEGRVTAVGDLSATVAGTLANVDGTLAANGNTTIEAADLDNTRGTAAAVNGDLRVTTAGVTTNTAGKLQAGGNVALANGGLVNIGGKVGGNSLSVDTRGNALDNTQGTLAATQGVDLKSGALTNTAGLIQSGGAVRIDTNGQALINTAAASYDNKQGGITSGDTLTLSTGAVNNTAGFIGAKGALSASTQAFTNATGGLVLGQGAVTIHTNGAGYDNRGGQTQAIGDLRIDAGAIDNTASLIRSLATTTLNAGALANASTQGTDQGIEGKNVVIGAGHLDNTSGAIRADVNVTIASGGTVNNTAGLISAVGALQIKDTNAANPAAKTLAITNTNGTLVADKSLRLDAAAFSGDGKAVAGQDLSIRLTQDLVNNAEVSANGDLTYATTGNLTNNGKLLAGGTLTVGGNNVDNTSAAEMTGTNTAVSAAGTLTNRGLIDSSGETQIDAGMLNNVGAGRIYGDRISISAGTLNNDVETINGQTRSGSIAARGDLDIGAGTLNNREHALIFSVGDMYIGGALDANRFAIGKAGAINNASATIESLGAMSLAAVAINNIDAHMQVVRRDYAPTPSDPAHPVTIIPTGLGVEMPWEPAYIATDDARNWATIQNGQLVTGKGWTVMTRTDTVHRDEAVNPADPGRIVSGGDMTIDGMLHNRDSHVLSGGRLTIDPANVDNTPTMGQEVIDHGGTGIFVPGVTGNNMVPFAIPIEQEVRTIAVGTNRIEQFTNATSIQGPGVARSVSVAAQAGAAGSGVSGGRAGAILEVPSAVGGVVKTSSSTADATGSAAGASGTAGSSTIALVVRTSTPNTTIPSASLFGLHAGPGSYLVETDPRFANYRQWLSSDYLLNALGLDPNFLQKRLGDGFYEQKLIREQVAQLTGYRYLDGFYSDEEQYTALMNAGATFAKAYGLRPGVALTAEQMAQLTSDIVWLVEQTVTLPDGSTQRVLVPQVYVRVQPGDIDGSGSLLSADRMVIKGAPGGGDLINRGTIAGRTLVSINADNINNLGGRIAGGSVALDARNDLNNIGGSITAHDAAVLTAGRNINIETTTSTQKGAQAGMTNIDRVAGVYVTNPGGTLVASAGNDVNVVGAIIANTGKDSRTLINAGHDINLGTVTEARNSAMLFNARNFRVEASSQEVGSQVVGGGSVTLKAANDINARAAGVAAEGTLVVIADRDVNITEGRATRSTAFASYEEKKSTFSKRTSTLIGSEADNTSIGSSFSGGNVVISAGNDLAVRGSSVVAQDLLSLSAGRDVRIESSQDHGNGSSYSASSKKGYSASWASGLSYGSGFNNRAEAGSSTTQVGSTVSGGNVSIDGGRDVQVIASNVLADKNIAITAGRNIDILSAQDVQSSSSVGTHANKTFGFQPGLAPRHTAYANVRGTENGTGDSSTAVTSLLSANGGNLTMVAGLDSKYSGSGQGNITTEGADLLAKDKVTLSGNAVNLNAATSSGRSTHSAEVKNHTIGAQLTGTVGGAITRAYDMAQESKNTDDSRLQGALALKAGYDAYKLATDGALGQGIQGLSAPGASGDPAGAAFGVSVSEQRSKQRSASAESATTQRGTNIQAGSIDITARETDINMTGAKLQARDISLDAKRDINLLAAQNTAATAGNSSGRSFGGGVTFGFGSQNGFSIQVNAGSNQGKSTGNEVRYDNTLVTATDTLKIKSGGDLNMRGAQVAGDTVKADIGGNLNIESLQDRTEYASQQSSGGVNVSLCIPPICYGELASATVDYSKQRVNHNYRSATGQSGIVAGNGGFDISVKGNTDLKGGAITSTAPIDKNSFTTGSLTTSDLENKQRTNSSSTSVSVSVSSGANAYSAGTSAATNAARSVTSTALANLNGGRGLPGNTNQTSQTLSVISPGTIKIVGTGVKEVDDKSNTNVATLTTRDPETANGALVNTLTLQQAKEIPRLQQEAQDRQRAAQLVGSVVDNVIGDVSHSLNRQAQEQENQRATAAGEAPRVVTAWADGSTEKIVLHGLAGVIQARVSDGSVLVGATAGAINEAMLPVLVEYLKKNGYDYEDPALTREQKAQKKQAFDSLLTAGSTLLGAAVGAATGDAGLGATVANNATVNNYLKHKDVDKLAKKIKDCGADTVCKDKAIDDAYRVSTANDIELLNCRATNNCDELKAEYRKGYGAIQDLIGAGMDPADVGRILNLETNAQTIIRNGLDQRQCTTQACRDNANYLAGIGKGLSKITPAGLVAGSGIAAYELTTAILNNGLTDTAVSLAQGIAGLPAELKNRLASDDPQVKGEALVDALALGGVATAVTAKLGQVGYAGIVKQVESRAAVTAEQQAADKLKIELNARADDYQQYDPYRMANSPRKGGEWDWSRMAPNNGAVPGTTQAVTLETGTLDRFGSRFGSFFSPAGTPYEQRALGPGSKANGYAEYEILRPINGERSVIAPAFDQPGGGYQYQFRIPEVDGRAATVNDLLKYEYIKVK
ncbi:hemagglutinin repeat-containing protein [Variovorax sp. MHTC-1]|uniref:hemagglutinin repeat-containing protein n=2 Tax=Variovorax sp. MHTC-1 TaxID=2495593 RepID=UPI0021AFB586|nr:hemagglutinin repeat-containing protein [Variovorax sp. MHTC-1]